MNELSLLEVIQKRCFNMVYSYNKDQRLHSISAWHRVNGATFCATAESDTSLGHAIQAAGAEMDQQIEQANEKTLA